MTGNNYSEIIGNVIEHGVSNNLEIVSDSGVPTVDERKLIKIPKSLGYFSLSTNDKIIYSLDYIKRLWVESPNLALDKIDNCEKLYFSGKRISVRNPLTVDKIRLATVNLNNIKIGGNVKKLSVTKSTVKKEIIDKMIIYHVGKSVATELRVNI